MLLRNCQGTCNLRCHSHRRLLGKEGSFIWMVAAANVEGVLIRVQYTIAEGM